MNRFHFTAIVCLAACTTQAGCKPPPPPPLPPPAPVLSRLEEQAEVLRKELANTQEEVRSLLATMVEEIEAGNIDAAAAADQVEETIEKVKDLKKKFRKLQDDMGKSEQGPLA